MSKTLKRTQGSRVYVVTNAFGEKQKLKIGSKVSRLVGCSYSWRDQGVIVGIARKKWFSYLPASNVAKIKNLAGDIVEIELDNLEKR
jgi:hypothetical protein